jgi:hypothetical protein
MGSLPLKMLFLFAIVWSSSIILGVRGQSPNFLLDDTSKSVEDEAARLRQQGNCTPRDVTSLITEKAMIEAPEELMTTCDSTQFIGVQVSPENGAAPWRVFRSYSEFEFLHKAVTGRANKYIIKAPFPKKNRTV